MDAPNSMGNRQSAQYSPVEAIRGAFSWGMHLRIVGCGNRLLQDVVAKVNALIADVHIRWSGDQLAHLCLILGTERAIGLFLFLAHDVVRRPSRKWPHAR